VTRRLAGLTVAIVHVALAASLGAKLLYDRAALPRVWVRAIPYDPDLPLRGRYVSLQVVVQASATSAEPPRPGLMQPAKLRVEGDTLIAEADPDAHGSDASDVHLRGISRGAETLTVLAEPVAYFIPEHVADPSRRPPGEQLWVEATIPSSGPPRPIRLGVKKGDGPVAPLQLD
jgi:hypothetical protein